MPDGALAAPRQPKSTPSVLYRVLRRGAGTALRLFYRHIEVTGLEHLDGHAPTILASTHPNSIVDPILVGIFEGRQVTFCARDGLFRVPLFGTLLRAVGAVAIRRRSDHPHREADPADAAGNDDAFAECRAVLQRGGVISIFPEGKTHGHLRVEPMKTGVARIAIDAEQGSERPLGVRIVPVGLNYLVREAFRSDVHVAFGPPIIVSELLAEVARTRPELAADPRATVRALTEVLGESLRSLAVHIEREEDERLIAQVTAIIVDIRAAEGLDAQGQSPAERTALVRRIVDAHAWLRESDPVRHARLIDVLERYLDERARLGVGGKVDTALQRSRERRLGREDRSMFGPLGLLLGAPLGLLGILTVALPYVVLRLLLMLGRPAGYRVALTKLLGGTALFGGWYALLSLWVWQHAGIGLAAATFVGLIPLGMFGHRYAIDLRLHRFGLRSNLRRMWQARRFARLRFMRKRLQLELAAIRKLYLAERGGAA